MKQIIHIMVLIFLSQFTMAESEHEHHHKEPSNSELTLNDGKKWKTDKVLRKNMDDIHNIIKGQLSMIQEGKVKDKEYVQLGKKIESSVQNIFKSCKLEARADAQLHIIMVGLVAENAKLLGKSNSSEKRKAVNGILAHYKSYLKFFDHTGEQ